MIVDIQYDCETIIVNRLFTVTMAAARVKY